MLRSLFLCWKRCEWNCLTWHIAAVLRGFKLNFSTRWGNGKLRKCCLWFFFFVHETFPRHWIGSFGHPLHPIRNSQTLLNVGMLNKCQQWKYSENRTYEMNNSRNSGVDISNMLLVEWGTDGISLERLIHCAREYYPYNSYRQENTFLSTFILFMSFIFINTFFLITHIWLYGHTVF